MNRAALHQAVAVVTVPKKEPLVLPISRHELVELFWTLWLTADGQGDGAHFWTELVPALDRLDRLCESEELHAASRGAIMPIVNGLRTQQGAQRPSVEDLLRRLANVVLPVIQGEYEF